MHQPEIVQAIPIKDYTVYLYYDDGKVRLYDAKPLVEKGEAFE